ncbi:MAG: MBL fold metallo-hydrolase [Nevskiaceae bacterium]|nr:MAG: MBL fold metallo-hydrolase [Nevskiaceae bacterium]TBR74321.1 MAG: MBL fold metallo-hydrolase [Nevskiaceae bacterium]
MANYERLDDNVVCIDTEQHRANLAACYLIGSEHHYAFIECGTSRSVPALLQVLVELGISTADVDYVMPTHVHLDHAGGAGALLRELPNARLVVHPRGARHLIDPTKLIAGATAVYGVDAVQEMYGEIVPVPEGRVIVADVAADHDFWLALGRRPLLLIDAPGHARHHYVVWDAASRGWFSGDSFGISYREFDCSVCGHYLIPTTTPVDFDPEAWNATLDRMLARTPACIYLTHYGRVGDVQMLGRQLRAGIAAYARIARAHAGDGDRHAALVAALLEYHLRQFHDLRHPMPQARAEALLKMDVELNAQGLEVWMDRQDRAARAVA